MSNKETIAITKPSVKDVIFQKGLHPGTIHYRKILHEKASDYDVALKHITKDTIAHSIYNQVRRRGRFLAGLDDGKYYVVRQEPAIVKIKQALRDHRKTKKIRSETPTHRKIKKIRSDTSKTISKQDWLFLLAVLKDA